MQSTVPQPQVRPIDVPKRRLHTGASMPAIGLGTFGSDHASPAEIAEAVRGAIEAGYRHLDCASVYANEAEIGRVLDDLFHSGLRREELWITSKLWNDKHNENDVVASCRKSIADLQCRYLDSYLVHWPFPNYHPAGCSIESRSPDAKPYIHENFMRTWRQMERLVASGMVRHIGTSNVTIPKLKLILRDARVKPAVNEMELHPHFQQPELFDFVVANGIAPIGYSPLGSPNRPERDRTPEDTSPLTDPVIVAIAQRLGVHPATVCIQWAIQRGGTAIPFSTKPANYVANLRASVAAPLSDEDMRAIAGVDRNCRLIKGHVFLWKSGQTWEALWDMDGEITPP
jgi:alcohol dehydrogenase (NADP+)